MQLGELGEKSQTYSVSLDAAGAAEFARAIAYTGPGVPPTWLTCLRKGEFELFERFEIPLASVLHAEQRYVWDHPVSLPAEFAYETSLVQATEKSSGSRGKLTFVVFETQVRNGDQVCASGRTTVAVREIP